MLCATHGGRGWPLRMSEGVMTMANIKDVAALAGLSAACVSKYLKSPDSVLPSSRERIQAAIEQLNYIPSRTARSLRTKKTLAIRVVMQRIDNPFFAEMFEGLRRELELAGYTALLQNTDREPAAEDFTGVDGVIFCFGDDERMIAAISELITGRLPMVCMHWREPRFEHPAVWVDVSDGMRLAAEFLLDEGCRDFAYVGGPRDSVISAFKFGGVRSALGEAGVFVGPGRIFHGDFSFQTGYDAAKALVRSGALPQAVFCETDELAAGVICGFYRQGVAVPEQVRVTGFNNTPLAEMYIPSITSIALPFAEICSQAARLMMCSLDGQTPENVCVRPVLIERRS